MVFLLLVYENVFIPFCNNKEAPSYQNKNIIEILPNALYNLQHHKHINTWIDSVRKPLFLNHGFSVI